MQIELKCYATLKEMEPESGKLRLAEGARVEDALQAVDMPTEKVKLIFVNGIHANLKKELKSGDRVGVFPPVGGG